MSEVRQVKKRAEKLYRVRHAFRQIFLHPNDELKAEAEIVLNELRRFCHATDSAVKVSSATRTIDPMALAICEGRREVWLKITQNLYLSDETIIKLMELKDE